MSSGNGILHADSHTRCLRQTLAVHDSSFAVLLFSNLFSDSNFGKVFRFGLQIKPVRFSTPEASQVLVPERFFY